MFYVFSHTLSNISAHIELICGRRVFALKHVFNIHLYNDFSSYFQPELSILRYKKTNETFLSIPFKKKEMEEQTRSAFLFSVRRWDTEVLVCSKTFCFCLPFASFFPLSFLFSAFVLVEKYTLYEVP